MTFLPCACTPASSASTVAEPDGRVRWRSASSANSSSKVFIEARAYRAAYQRIVGSIGIIKDVELRRPNGHENVATVLVDPFVLDDFELDLMSHDFRVWAVHAVP